MKMATEVTDVHLQHVLSKSKVVIALGESPFDTVVIMNTLYGDHVIGCIQDLLLHINADNQLGRKLEITFPKMDAEEWKTSPFPKTISENVEDLESLGFVTVKYKELISVPSVVEEKETVFAASSDEDFERSLAMVRGQK